MPLQPGNRLGSYDVIAQIGTGGMGEVYRARDTRLNREVAMKVLPDAFAHDADRLARFRREAQVLAALNHPHIAQIHGLEETDGVQALVMELVDGPTLAEVITGPAATSSGQGLPLDEALDIARQIAEALEAAHEQGIVHRDLKPANIKLRATGAGHAVKVLDFGLAKAVDSPGAPSGAHPPGTSLLPTMTSPALMTQAGIILGTAAYMAPEQARGKPVDRRADLWAFGCVLYEMLTGRRAFEAEDVSLTLSRILQLEPDWAALPAGTPASIRRLLRRCLTKDPRQRLADASTIRLEILEAVAPADNARPVEPPARQVPLWRRALPIAMAVLVTAAAVGAAAWTLLRRAPETPVQLTVAHPAPEVVGGNAFDANIAISPDGRHIAYVASASLLTDNTLRLYLRTLDQRDATLLSSSARTPFFSPDGQWVGFVEDNARLSKIAITGGPSVSIGGNANGTRGASWGPDGTIVFATTRQGAGLSRIQAAGGDATVLTKPDAARGETNHVFPQFLPGGRAILFTILSAQGPDRSQIAVFDLARGTSRVLIQGGSHGVYSPSGHLVYGVAGTLRAVEFDASTLEVRGTPVPVLQDVVTRPSGAASFSVSADGTLAYVRGALETVPLNVPAWVDGTGRVEPLGLEPRRYLASPALAPGGRRLALSVSDGANTTSDLWVWSFDQRTLSRLTFEPGTDGLPLWTPDGSRIVYRSSGDRGTSLSWRPADGTGTAQVVVAPKVDLAGLRPTSWSPDGRLVLDLAQERNGIYSVAPGKGDMPSPLLVNPKFGQQSGSVSPDGRWLAYLSFESGTNDVFVRPFPDVESGKWQVSSGGVLTETPRWSADGRTLYFVSGDVNAPVLMRARVQTAPTFAASAPERITNLPADGIVGEIAADGRVLMLMPADDKAAQLELNVILHWADDLARRLAAQ